MATDEAPTADRWQDLIRSMDPVANLNALADVWRQAATASERVVTGVIDDRPGPAAADAGGARAVRLDIERTVDQMSDLAKQFFGRFAWPGPGPGATAEGAVVAVIDGIGTTEIAVPADGEPWCPGAARHDGAGIASEAITFWSSPTFAANGAVDDPSPEGSDHRSTIVRVTVGDDAPPGLYHGLVLCRGQARFSLPLTVKVIRSEQ